MTSHRCASRHPTTRLPAYPPTRLTRQRLLVVVELDIRKVEERDVEVEPEVPVGVLPEGERRAPLVEVTLQAHLLRLEPVGGEVVERPPLHAPERGRGEPGAERQ